ncbi:coiled-coil-helix-coiled-coil-helix domain-containing protein [Aspergillus ibericus CBS 121593]|uniref:Cytochrome c oxidase-assembly factor cox23 n=1 Tax=Aspergillus ibericus CBS 121593 TaxID=1448316 RepID=A0A395HDM9_9EURO|nr:cytochrome c oxidase-assembly factor cox23 [Aspergillus ibericus CBS 121593]RAL05840.1 cytochrome c oxidase-assembly factor cox23 [Aspergillus ibericus CBS 121593]
MASQSDQQPPSSEQTQTNAWERVERRFTSKPASEYFDPCQDFADRSLKCMKRNGFDREMCSDYFQAYRDCKKQWLTQKKLGSSAQKQ